MLKSDSSATSLQNIARAFSQRFMIFRGVLSSEVKVVTTVVMCRTKCKAVLCNEVMEASVRV